MTREKNPKYESMSLEELKANGRFTNTNSGTEWNYFCQQS